MALCYISTIQVYLTVKIKGRLLRREDTEAVVFGYMPTRLTLNRGPDDSSTRSPDHRATRTFVPSVDEPR